MILFQADADLNHDIVLSVRRKEQEINFASAKDARLNGMLDPEVLQIAAAQNRILITHDKKTMPGHFRDRMTAGLSSPGVFIVSQFAPIGLVAEAIVKIWAASDREEWRNQIHHLPSLAAQVFQITRTR